MDIEKELQLASLRGVCPPPNWASRALERIESLQQELSRKDGTIAIISNALSFAEKQSAEHNSKAQTLENENRRLKLDLEEARRESECRQSKIDSLMLEYCPDEMTPEQVAEWGRHQRRYDPSTPPKTPDAT